MKKILAILSLLCISCVANATVTISITAGELKSHTGSDLTVGDLVLLEANSGTGNFGTVLQAGQYASTGNSVLQAFAMNNNITTGAGQFLYTGTVAAGESLALVWFDNITYTQYLASVLPSTGQYYGLFAGVTSGTAPDGSDLWVTPSSGGTINLVMQTASLGGSQPNSTGTASTQVVPEPSSIALLGSGLLMAGSMIRRRK